MSENKKFVHVEAANIGDQKTTLTNLVGKHHKTLLNKILRRVPSTSFVVNVQISPQQIPCQLGPGERWTGSFEQTAELENMMKKGVFYIEVYHSSNPKPIYKRVRMK